jgi:hypothetical protein
LEWLDAAQLHGVVTALVNKQSKATPPGLPNPSRPPLVRGGVGEEMTRSLLDKGGLGRVEGEKK